MDVPAAAIRTQPVAIIGPSGEELCKPRADPRTSVSSLKMEIEKSTGIPVRQQRLLFDGTKLKDSETVPVGVFRVKVPELQLQPLSQEEVDKADARQDAFERLQHGTRFMNLEDALKEDPEVALWVVQHVNPAELQHAADCVKADRDAMLEAMKVNTLCKVYVADELWHDRVFIQGVVQIDGLELGSAQVSEQWRSDHGIVLYACENNGLALEFASKELKNAREIVLAAVNQRGTSLKWASQELQSDYYIVKDAVRNNKMAIVHAKGGLRDDDDIRAIAGQGASQKGQRDRLKAKFRELDTNGDGYLSFDELAALLHKGNPDMTDAEIRLLYGKLDIHQDGKVDFSEFCDFIHG